MSSEHVHTQGERPAAGLLPAVGLAAEQRSLTQDRRPGPDSRLPELGRENSLQTIREEVYILFTCESFLNHKRRERNVASDSLIT